jgi:hypothetical protein
VAGQKGGAKQLVWLTYERSRHPSPSPGLHHPSEQPQGDCDLQPGRISRFARIFRSSTLEPLVGQSPLPLCAKWGTSCLPIPSNQPGCFICESLITWSAWVAATPHCVPCVPPATLSRSECGRVFCGYSWSDRYYFLDASDTAVTRGRGPPVPPSRRSISSKRRIRSSTSLRR